VQWADVLCGEGGVVHEEKLNIGNCKTLVESGRPSRDAARTVGDEESLVAGGHQVAGLLVGSVTDLSHSVSPDSRCDCSHTRRSLFDVVRSWCES
jgi:hypothetical protein